MYKWGVIRDNCTHFVGKARFIYLSNLEEITIIVIYQYVLQYTLSAI